MRKKPQKSYFLEIRSALHMYIFQFDIYLKPTAITTRHLRDLSITSTQKESQINQSKSHVKASKSKSELWQTESHHSS